MKANFTAKTAKGLRSIANTEHKGMNAAIRSIVEVWNSKKTDLTDALEACKNDGLTIEDFSADFILTHLAGTKWVSENGKTILMNKKGTMVAKATWTPGAIVDYVRRANSYRLAKVESK